VIQSKKAVIYTTPALLMIFLFWLFQKYSFVFFIELFLGFVIGNIILELDHFVYWFVINPKSQESQIAQKLVKQFSLKKLYHFYLQTKDFHKNLIFHHFYTQIALIVISIFVLTSSNIVTSCSLIFFTNLNLFIKQIFSYTDSKSQFQSWLFARMPKQISPNNLIYYLIILAAFNFFFLAKMINL